MTSTPIIDTAALLAAARRDRFEADAAERRVLQHAFAWAQLHATDDEDQMATFGDSPVSLAGQGAPHVLQFAVFEFGAVLGMSRRSAESLVGDALELGHRLPRTWGRVTAGRLKAWRARQIAQATQVLSLEAAAYVDAQVAVYASRISASELQRLIDTAIARYMPGYAEQIASKADQTQFLEIAYDQPSYTGTCRIAGELDMPDALDLEQAVQAGAEQQKTLGSQHPLGFRRAKSLGNLARGELAFDYNSGLPDPTETPEDLRPPTVAKRQVVLYLHLSQDAITGTRTGSGDGTGLMENAGKQLVTSEQIRQWCRTAGAVTVRPVIDLNEEISNTGYRPSNRLREQVILRDRWCPFPFCECDARHSDLDHIKEYDPDGPPGQTATSNFGAPCRTHHRVKTFSTWTYTMIESGVFLWRSPHGYQFLKDRNGTRDVTPPPIPGPG
ncbi:MAG: endonuclease [Marmoricola sp.]|nr:endonuclease [Marmoricola sp.]